jgi:hypothetical protein
LLQSLVSELVSPNIQIFSYQADKAAQDFAAFLALAYSLSTRKTTKLDQKYEMSGLYNLLKHKRKVRKLWQETKDPKCKMAVDWVTHNMRRMVWKTGHGIA